ncbi:glycosyltransferase family 2 protein [Photorhabdus bodei]|uniref:Glycosyl transferase family 2 n=1 Tax=Photorhabdus bodei TaxID=2029681 RepID=A0A329X9S7_9GAMM|nr:glycosyltransferase family 2 protein [Photorhabdus bodei]RAX12740.1 glycosyl transferase family 2 [Photorhabdus bodei]
MLNIVIPMAGRGSRFSSAGYIDPKPLILLENKRMIEVVANNLKPSCPHRFIFICQQEHLDKYNYKKELERISPGSIVIGIDGVTEGAACTVMFAEQYIDNDEPLMIANSDQWVDIDINDYLSKMDIENLDGLIMTMKANDPKWSYAQLNEKNNVVKVVEKIVVSDEATVGIYNYKRGKDFCLHVRKMIERDERSNGEFYVAPVYTYMYEYNNANIGIYNVGSEADGMYGLGTPADLTLFKSLPVYSKAILF